MWNISSGWWCMSGVTGHCYMLCICDIWRKGRHARPFMGRRMRIGQHGTVFWLHKWCWCQRHHWTWSVGLVRLNRCQMSRLHVRHTLKRYCRRDLNIPSYHWFLIGYSFSLHRFSILAQIWFQRIDIFFKPDNMKHVSEIKYCPTYINVTPMLTSPIVNHRRLLSSSFPWYTVHYERMSWHIMSHNIEWWYENIKIIKHEKIYVE